jgi:hypothetical protein
LLSNQIQPGIVLKWPSTCFVNVYKMHLNPDRKKKKNTLSERSWEVGNPTKNRSPLTGKLTAAPN